MIFASFAKILVSFAKILVSLLNLLLIFSKHAILRNFSMYTSAKTRKHGSWMQIKLRLRPMGVTDRQTDDRQTDTQTYITDFEAPLHKRPFGQKTPENAKKSTISALTQRAKVDKRIEDFNALKLKITQFN